jgi:hypothetical protein
MLVSSSILTAVHDMSEHETACQLGCRCHQGALYASGQAKISGVKEVTYVDPVEDRRSAEPNLARIKSNMT